MYLLYFIPLAIIIIAVTAEKISESSGTLIRKSVNIIIPLFFLTRLFTIEFTPIFYDLPGDFKIKSTDFGKTISASKEINFYFKPGDLVFTLDESLLPLQSRLRILPAFSFRYEMYKENQIDEKNKKRYWNIESLEKDFKDYKGVILQKDKWPNYFSKLKTGKEVVATVNKLIAENCRLVLEINDVFPERYKYNNGTAVIYKCNEN
jgi:hypothetical protein